MKQTYNGNIGRNSMFAIDENKVLYFDADHTAEDMEKSRLSISLFKDKQFVASANFPGIDYDEIVAALNTPSVCSVDLIDTTMTVTNNGSEMVCVSFFDHFDEPLVFTVEAPHLDQLETAIRIAAQGHGVDCNIYTVENDKGQVLDMVIRDDGGADFYVGEKYDWNKVSKSPVELFDILTARQTVLTIASPFDNAAGFDLTDEILPVIREHVREYLAARTVDEEAEEIAKHF